MGKLLKAYKKLQDGGPPDLKAYNIDTPYNPFNTKGEDLNVTYKRPIPFTPQKSKLRISDRRKVDATSGKPNTDPITGDYSTERIDNIIHYAKMYKADPWNMLATDLQETDLGKNRRDKTRLKGIDPSLGISMPDPGHVLMGDEDLHPSSKIDRNKESAQLDNGQLSFKDYSNADGYDAFARAYVTKVNEAKKKGLPEVDQLQNYNGRGYVNSSTAQAYHGFKMKSIYGVPIPPGGINLKDNPLYGKRVIDYRDNILKKSPEIDNAIQTVYELGGTMKTVTKPAKKSLLSHYKKMATGGDNSLLTDANGNVLPDTGSADWATFGQKRPFNLSSGAVSAAAGVLDTGVNLLSPKDKYGVQSNAGAIAGGALKDAALGFSVAGPIGAGVGAIFGGVEGLLGNKKAQKAKNIAIKNQFVEEQGVRNARSGAAIASDPSLKYGNLQASYYAMGGTMKGTVPQVPRLKKPMAPVQPKQRVMPPIADVPGRQLSRMAKGGSMHPEYNISKQTKPYRTYMPHVPTQNLSKMEDGGIHIKPENKGKFNATKAATGKSTEELTHSSNPVTKKRAIFAQNASHWNKGANGGQVFKTTDPSYKFPQFVMGADGGKLESMSMGNAKVEGASHANGGVKFPGAGVELEGDETLNGDFVFSKKLGFAQTHEKIAKAQGRVEKKPDTVVNRNTLKALGRQTNMLKQQQEATKQAMGIPNEMDKGTMANGGKLYKRMDLGGDGGPGDPKKKTIAKEPPLMTVHADGHIGPWGNDIKPGGAIPLPAINPAPVISDKAAGLSSNYYTPGQIPVKPAVATIPRSSNFYRNGGKLMKKMADGGDRFPLLKVTDPGALPLLPELDGMPANLQLDNAPTKTAGTVANGSLSSSSLGSGSSSKSGAVAPKGRLIDKINAAGDTLTPFLPNLYEATRKLPLPPTPSLESEIAPALVDYSASRNEAVRQTRGANKAAEDTLNTGAAVAATRAANLAGQIRAVSSINEAENSANAGIRNQANQVNMQVRARNNSLRNQYQHELTERQIKGQELTGQNLASISEKIQGIKRDNKADNLDEQRLMIEALKDNTGASYRGARQLFAKHLSKEDMAYLDELNKTRSKEDKADRDAQSSVDKTLADQAKKARPVSDAYKSQADILRGKSVVLSAADLKLAKQSKASSEELTK